MGDNLSDLYREVFGESPASRAVREGAPRPLPQRPQVNNPAARRYNEHRRAPQVRQDFAANAGRQAYQPPRNQIAELPQLAFETTGIPSLGRAYQGYANATSTSDMQAANEQAINGVLGVTGWAVPGLRGEAPRVPRAFPDFGALPEATPALRPPPRQIGANGMPIAEAQPFRNSMRGGSADLAEAAGMRGPDAGPLRGEPVLRGYHGSTAEGLTELRPGERGPMGPATYLSTNKGVAGRYGPNLYEADAPNIFHGLGSSGFADSSINPYEVWRTQLARLLDAAEPDMRPQIAAIAERMHPADGYPFFRRLANLYGSDEAAQALFRRAGFDGISGHVDGPEIAVFGNVTPRTAPDGGPAPAGSSRQPMERLALSPEREAQLRSRTRDLEDNTPTDVRLRVDAMRQQAEMEKRMAGIENWPPERVAEFYRTLERMNPVAAERMLETLSRRVGELRMQEIFGSPRPPPNGAMLGSSRPTSEWDGVFARGGGRPASGARGQERFYNSQLSPQQNKAVEMLRNGFSGAEIADELGVGVKTVDSILSQARARIGSLVPLRPPGQFGRPDARGYTSADLLRMNEREGMNARAIAEETGIPHGSIKARLSQERARRRSLGDMYPGFDAPNGSPPRPPPNGAKSVRNTPGQKPGFSLSGALRRN